MPRFREPVGNQSKDGGDQRRRRHAAEHTKGNCDAKRRGKRHGEPVGGKKRQRDSQEHSPVDPVREEPDERRAKRIGKRIAGYEPGGSGRRCAESRSNGAQHWRDHEFRRTDEENGQCKHRQKKAVKT